jgi:DNA polymerase elongation subunit (family B)
MISWEGDLTLPDRFLMDRYATMPEWKPRVWHLDLEWDPKEDFTTVIGIADNYTKERVAFCWSEESAESLSADEVIEETRSMSWENSKGVESSVTYRRVLCNSEAAMYTKFLEYLEVCDPDVFVAHALMWADLPHIIRRLDNKDVLGKGLFRKLSPLNRVRKPDKEKGYDYTDQPVRGRLCFDTAAPLSSGTGFERVWKDSGKPQLASRKLDHITGEEVLDYGGKLEMDVFTGWYERFDEFVDYCMRDVELLKMVDERNHILEFYMSLQQVCGVSFPSCHNVTRFARGLISRRTDWKPPTHSPHSKAEYEGAYIPPPTPGRYEGVACVDYKGLYPSLILSHNLSWESQVDREYRFDDDVRELPDGTCWRQGEPALLPRIVTEMFELRDDYKRRMRESKTDTERSGWNTMQLAVKRVMASLYGMCASTHWGWSAPAIASAITACGREAIRFLMEESEKQGYSALYGHTDSAFVQIPFEEAPALARHLTETVQREHQASALIVEFEAYMPYWIVGGKNLYYGICSWPPEDEGKAKSARWGKISTLAPVSRTLERDVLTKVCSGANENEVVDHVRGISLGIMQGDYPVAGVAGVTRIQKSLDKYAESVGVPGVKGARYYNLHLVEKSVHPKFKNGDSVKWVYVSEPPQGMPPTDIVAYHEEEELKDFTLDYDKMVDKLVSQKVKPIFNALGWSLDYATGKPKPKKYW